MSKRTKTSPKKASAKNLEGLSRKAEKPLASSTKSSTMEDVNTNPPVEQVTEVPTTGAVVAENPSAPVTGTETSGEKKMEQRTLTFTKLSKSGTYAIYAGLRAKVRIPVTVFPESKPVDSFTANGEFAGARTRKPAMTKEERAAYRAAQPKLTLAQKIAKQEAKLDKMRKAQSAQPTEQTEQAVGSF